MVKFISAKQATGLFKNGQTLMIGGFLDCGSPTIVIDELLQTPLTDFTLIANDTGTAETNRGKLVVAGKIKKAIVSHIGTNTVSVAKYNAGNFDVDFQPQGSLAERIRADGAGLGGILTPVGVGTDIAKGKQIIKIKDREFLLETPLHADIAVVYATYADKFGNLAFHGSTRNFNVIMPMAADVVIVEAEHLMSEPLSPDQIVVPGIFVDYIIERDNNGNN